MDATLIISTYNWPEALELVLLSVAKQRVMPKEVIIADDGSAQETKSLIHNIKKNFPIPLLHVWHEDTGFNKSTILNKAVASSNSDYIIQADGDCILHPSFVKDHLNFSKKGHYLFGSRVNIQKHYLKSLFFKKQIQFNSLSKGIKNRTRAIYFPSLTSLYKVRVNISSKYRGCNTSYYKSDFIAINGYNEDIKGWGREDSELALRFHNNGIRAKRLRYSGIVYHIYHTEKSKSQLIRNNEIEKDTIKQNKTWCVNGIDAYLNED